jgi:hypothetical protein
MNKIALKNKKKYTKSKFKAQKKKEEILGREEGFH